MKYIVTIGDARTPARFWDPIELDDTEPADQVKLDQYRKENRPIKRAMIRHASSINI